MSTLGDALSILSQLLRIESVPLEPRFLADAQGFQFFPSCCRPQGARGAASAPALSILSQLLPAKTTSVPRAWRRVSLSILSQLLQDQRHHERRHDRRQGPFQFFPSCCPQVVLADWRYKKYAFNSFPVAARAGGRRERAPRARAPFQFFPSCCVEVFTQYKIKLLRAFNSFPVAARAPRTRSWILTRICSRASSRSW